MILYNINRLPGHYQKSFGKKIIDPEPLFISSINNKLDDLISAGGPGISTLVKSSLRYYEFNDAEKTNISDYFDNADNNERIIEFMGQLKSEQMKFEPFFESLEKQSQALLSQAGMTDGHRTMWGIQALLIHILLARDINTPTHRDVIASIVKYKYPDKTKIVVWDRIKNQKGEIFRDMKNGEILINIGLEDKIKVKDKDKYKTIKGNSCIYCITPNCDIFRPNKIGAYIKFIKGIDLKGDKIKKLLHYEPKAKDNIHHIRYMNQKGEKHLIRLNFANTVSLRLPGYHPIKDKKAIQEQWANWESIIFIREPYAHNILNKYLAYQSRSGVEDLNW